MSQPTHNRVLIIVILGALSTISPFAIDMYLPAFPAGNAGRYISIANGLMVESAPRMTMIKTRLCVGWDIKIFAR